MHNAPLHGCLKLVPLLFCRYSRSISRGVRVVLLATLTDYRDKITMARASDTMKGTICIKLIYA